MTAATRSRPVFMKPRFFDRAGIVVLAMTCSAGLVACAGSARPASVSGDDVLPRGVALAAFDTLWAKVSETYVDTAFVTGRWIMVRDSLRPRAERITGRRGLARLFSEALHHIPDSHFYIIPAKVAAVDSASHDSDGRGTTGVSIRMVGDQAVVWRVDPGGPAARAGITPGEVVLKVAARDAERSIEQVNAMPEQARPRAMSQVLHALNGALSPSVGDTVTLVLGNKLSPTAHPLVAIPAQGRVSQFGNLPPIAGLVRSARLPAGSAGGPECVGFIAFNIWLPLLGGDLERAFDDVSTCSGVVVDLRGNPGGVGAMVMGFGGYFVDSAVSLGTMRTRQVSLKFVINPRRSRDDGSQRSTHSGPLAILVDPMTASTSEIFATGMQRIGRARVFGERSAGAALPALMERLPSGDVFVHAVADFTDPMGNRIEGAGVIPDEIVALSQQALKEGRDGALEAAVRWITANPTTRSGQSAEKGVGRRGPDN